MFPAQHTATSGVVSVIFALVTRSWPGTIACFLSGILMDADHLLDYIVSKRRMTISFDKLHQFCGRQREGKLVLALHSVEFLGMVWAAIIYFHLDVIWTGVAVGMSTHLICDQFSNPIRPFVYFLLYRLRHGFDKKWIFREDYYQKLE